MGTPSSITSDHRDRPLPRPTMGALPIALASCSCCFAVWNWATHSSVLRMVCPSYARFVEITKLLW